MNYRSLQDLSRDIVGGMHRVPWDIDLVVGIPRSGMLAALQIALLRNLHVCSLQEYIDNSDLAHGNTRPLRAGHGRLAKAHDAREVLVVDDSIAGGSSMEEARATIRAAGTSARHRFAAIYATPEAVAKVDLAFVELSMPRRFQWNLLHGNGLEEVFVDMDGILCLDPTPAQNDDGSAYARFLENAKPYFLPSGRIGGIITSRLEKYREATERWLSVHGVQYGQLHMLDLPDAATRRRSNAHASFKAQVYRRLVDARLYVESESIQAVEIHRLTGKPVIDFHGSASGGANRGVRPKDRIKSMLPDGAVRALRGLPGFLRGNP